MADTPLTAADAAELEALIAQATDEDLSDGGRYFDGHYNDLTQCGHGDTGNYGNQKDGELVEFLWNRRHQILALLSKAATTNEAAERGYNAAIAAIRAWAPGFENADSRARLEAVGRDLESNRGAALSAAFEEKMISTPTPNAE
jgi:hypothetical protein